MFMPPCFRRVKRMHFFCRIFSMCLAMASIFCLGNWHSRTQTSQPQDGPFEPPKEIALTYETLLHAQQLRKIRLRSFCDTYRKFNNPPSKEQSKEHDVEVTSNLVYNTKLELMYCNAPALGLGRWQQLLQVLQDTPEATIWTPVVSNLSLLAAAPQNGGSAFNLSLTDTFFKSYTKVLFIRDPFERLVFSYIQQYADKIKFRDFILNVLSRGPRKLASRWKPLVSLCHPCLIRYDYIISYQSLGIEVRHLMHRMRIPRENWMMKIAHPPFQGTYSWLSKKLFKGLTIEQRKELFQAYQEDFSAFQFPISLLWNVDAMRTSG